MIDGARNALGGYLYQIVGGTGLTARAVDLSDDEEGELLCELIIEARNARVLHEVHGEDLMLRREDAAENSGTAVQFKYSRHGAADLIRPSQLREILQAFHRCAAAASSEYPITSYVLVTNRELNNQVQEYYKRRSTSFDDLKEADRRWLRVPAGQRQEIEKQFEAGETAARKWYRIFQNLTIYPRIRPEYWLNTLREYARARGVYDDEFEPALNRLVGDALRTTVQSPTEFSQGWLNCCLVGFSEARSLLLSAPENDSALSEAAEAVRHWTKNSLGAPEEELVRRGYLDDLDEKLTQHPIVLVLGWGGCGKSVLAAQFLLASATSRFVAAASARDVRGGWLGQVFNTWRHLSPSQGPHLDGDVPKRLRHANPCEPRPILLIDIDGVDERGDLSWKDIRALTTLCRGQNHRVPDMALILTSRSTTNSPERDRRDLISKLFSVEYPEDVENLFGVIQVDDFTPPEFAMVVHRADTTIRGRLQQAAEKSAGDLLGTSVSESATVPDAGPAPPDIAASLRHPALWGVFSRLSLTDQHRVLDEQPAGFDRLTERFVERFCRKVNRRRPTLASERVRSALVRIAGSFPRHQTLVRRERNWITPAAPLVTMDEAALLFDEALSYGMIREEEPGRWVWRHRFLHDSLAREEA